MRCTQVEKLLPLYAGDDCAKARETAEVREHLATCAACRLKAEEFEASRRLLALHAPPAFDEDFFASVRRNVMREIEDEKTRPAPFAAFRQLFAPRTLAVAASLVLLVACALVAFQLYRRAAQQQQTPATETATTTTTTSPRRDDAPVEDTEKTGAHVVAQHEETGQKTFGAHARTSRATRRAASPQAQTVAHKERTPVEPSSTNETARPSQVEAVAVHQGATPTEAAERKVTRIELQTADPNVRIIWLSPREDDTPAIQRETKR
jgi:hypothetical protein